MTVRDDLTDPQLVVLADDENRPERYAPGQVRLTPPRRRACVLPALYLVLMVRTVIEVGNLMEPSFFWHHPPMWVPMALEGFVAFLLILCAVNARRESPLTSWLPWFCVLARVAITCCEVYVRGEYLWAYMPMINRTLFDFCVLMPFEAVAPVVILAIFASKGCRVAPDSGHCPNCGYSTYGLPGQVCPECGTSLSEPSERAT